ncbi:hypothetical protein ACSBR2_019192 [Camellia fascicularis]
MSRQFRRTFAALNVIWFIDNGERRRLPRCVVQKLFEVVAALIEVLAKHSIDLFWPSDYKGLGMVVLAWTRALGAPSSPPPALSVTDHNMISLSSSLSPPSNDNFHIYPPPFVFSTVRRLLHPPPFGIFVGLGLPPWLNCILDHPPRAIIIDQCKAMQNATDIVFPNARHRCCLWHIMKKILEKLKGYFQYESMKLALQNAVYDTITKDEFEMR